MTYNHIAAVNRRTFLEFMGRAGFGIASGQFFLSQPHSIYAQSPSNFAVTPIKPSASDELKLADGLHYHIIATWGDQINSKGEQFGFNNDYVAFLPLSATKPTDGLLVVNHESPQPFLLSDVAHGKAPTKKQVEKQMLALGLSIVRIRQDPKTLRWNIVANDAYNRRIHAATKIPIVADRVIGGSKVAVGTFANCSGGVTPWQTILSCEENYQDYFGDIDYRNSRAGKLSVILGKNDYGWRKYFDRPPEHYGWVVEVNPRTGKSKKLTALGRFSHECATIALAKDGRAVAYMGDDANDQCLYKFIASKPGSLDQGELYVASLETKTWISLDRKKQAKLAAEFKDQTEVLIRTREAAALVGGTPLDRPEDIEIDPANKSILVALTNNQPKKNSFGSILRIVEENQDPLAMRFEHTTFINGGVASGLSCPDNLAFDPAGNLWITNDQSGSDMHKGEYAPFGNNGLFVVPMRGADAGKVFQVASAPTDAEFTGPYFSPDGRTLFLSVQHPGERSKSRDKLTSHWPAGGPALPRSAVVAIQGAMLDRLVGYSG